MYAFFASFPDGGSVALRGLRRIPIFGAKWAKFLGKFPVAVDPEGPF